MDLEKFVVAIATLPPIVTGQQLSKFIDCDIRTLETFLEETLEIRLCPLCRGKWLLSTACLERKLEQWHESEPPKKSRKSG